MEFLGKNNELYKKIDLKDRETVKQLLYHKAEFQKSNFTSSGSSYDRIQPNHSLYTNLIEIYIDLENLILESDLTDKNMRLIRMVMSGYTINYIYTNFENYEKEATTKMFNRTLEKINETQRSKEAKKEDDNKTTQWRRKRIM